jgi:pyruvate kinase
MLRRLRAIRQVSEERSAPIATLLDLQGPKIRLGRFEGGECELETGSAFTITVEPVLGNRERASTDYAELAREVKPGDQILLADGAVHLRVLSSDGVAVRCDVVSGGVVGDRKGINLPGVRVKTPSLTRKDMADIQLALDAGIDLVALSFVRQPADMLRLRLFLEEKDAQLPIIAKIEKREAWENLGEILREADGVMVARGDLGVEMPLEKVPHIQKSIIESARLHGKFVITATQMLESMIENPTPTRAEVSDIANAIFDGTDAVMLSAETSTGKFPIDAVRMMARIANEADAARRPQGYTSLPPHSGLRHAEIVASSAYHAARSANVAAIVVFTTTGSTARLIARDRPPVPIFAFTTSSAAARQLAIVYGVQPVLAPAVGSTDEMLSQVDQALLERGWLKPGDDVVFVAGQPVGRPGTTNLMKLHRIGELR